MSGGGRQRLNQTLVTEFSERARITENHRTLARLPIETFWTTNYDHLIEDALREEGKKPDIKITPSNLTTTLPRRDAVVYKMHGDVSDPEKAIVLKDDYESYGASPRGQLFSTALMGDLVSKTFLFLGFSFSDPNVDYILSRIRILLKGERREHYYLLRSVQRQDFKKLNDFKYARIRQDLQIKDLRRYGIMAVLLDSFDQYTQTLQQLESDQAATCLAREDMKVLNFSSTLHSQIFNVKNHVTITLWMVIITCLHNTSRRRQYA